MAQWSILGASSGESLFPLGDTANRAYLKRKRDSRWNPPLTMHDEASWLHAYISRVMLSAEGVAIGPGQRAIGQTPGYLVAWKSIAGAQPGTLGPTVARKSFGLWERIKIIAPSYALESDSHGCAPSRLSVRASSPQESWLDQGQLSQGAERIIAVVRGRIDSLRVPEPATDREHKEAPWTPDTARFGKGKDDLVKLRNFAVYGIGIRAQWQPFMLSVSLRWFNRQLSTASAQVAFGAFRSGLPLATSPARENPTRRPSGTVSDLHPSPGRAGSAVG